MRAARLASPRAGAVPRMRGAAASSSSAAAAASSTPPRYPARLPERPSAAQLALPARTEHVRAPFAGRASDAAAAALGDVPQSYVADLVAFGAVYLCEHGATGKLRKLRADAEVAAGDVLRVHCHPRRFSAARRPWRDWAGRVVAPVEGQTPRGLVVVDKPSGVPCGPATVDNAVETLAAQVTGALRECRDHSPDGSAIAGMNLNTWRQVGAVVETLKPDGEGEGEGDGQDAFATLEPVGRLDVCTSGLVVLAADHTSARAGNERLKAGAVDKRYACRVVLAEGVGAPPEVGTLLEHWVLTGWLGGKTRVLPGVRSAEEAEGVEGAKHCALEVLSVSPADGAHRGDAKRGRVFDIELRLLTGRTHQIRAQFAAVGAPLLGDAVYGRATEPAIAAAERAGGDAAVRALYPSGRAPDRIALRCASLAWGSVRYEAPPATSEWDAIEAEYRQWLLM